MVVLHNPSTVTTPAAVLQVAGTAEYVLNRLLVNPKYWSDTESRYAGNDEGMWWYMVHGLLVLALAVWGLPLISVARRFQSNRLPALIFVVLYTLAGVVTAFPLIKLNRQLQIYGVGVFTTSLLFNLVWLIYLLDLVKGLVTTPMPRDYFSRQESHHFIGRLEAFYWFSGFQLVIFSIRPRLILMPVLNGLLHWLILLWHFYMLFYFGSHKPRYESATGLVDGEPMKETENKKRKKIQ